MTRLAMSTEALREMEESLARQARSVRAELDHREEADRIDRIQRLLAALPNVNPRGALSRPALAERIVRDVPPGAAEDLIAYLTTEGTA